MFHDEALTAQPVAQPPCQFGIVLNEKDAYDGLRSFSEKSRGNPNASGLAGRHAAYS